MINLGESIKIPRIGFGTYPMKGEELRNAVNSAYDCGFRLFDTACSYSNQKALGDALEGKEVFIESKLSWQVQHDIYEGLRSADEVIDEILTQLKVEKLDLLLLHWPYPAYVDKIWRCMEKMKEDGKVASIGVCNMKKRHIETLLSKAHVRPVVNQIEIHPLNAERELVSYCQGEGIAVEAYCPLGLMRPEIRNSAVFSKMSLNYKKTVAQIILRWHYQRGIIPLPKSSDTRRICQNLDIFDFELSSQDMKEIAAVNIDRPFYTPSFYCPGY